MIKELERQVAELQADGEKTNDDYHTVYYGEIVNAYIV